MCFEICRSSSPQTENRCCLQKALSKEALFAASLLLGSGAVLSYFTRLGNPLTISLGFTAGTTFLIACVKCASQKPKPPQNDSVIPDTHSSTKTENLFAQMSDQELVQQLTSELNPPLELELGSRLKNLLKANARKTSLEVALALEPFFAAAGDDLTKFTKLADLTTQSPYLFPFDFNSLCSPRVLADSLELICKRDMTKQSIVITSVTKLLYNTMCVTISLQNMEGRTNEISVDVNRIFGDEDFNGSQPISISTTLSMAVAKMILTYVYWQPSSGEIDKYPMNAKIFSVVFQHSNGGRIPTSMIRPILPYLKKIPGLVSLDFADIGGEMPYTIVGSASPISNSFRDDDADILLDIVRNNPLLKKVNINISAMSEAKRASFTEELQNILDSRNRSSSLLN